MHFSSGSGGARVFATRGKRLCCRPHPRNQISNWYSYGYNDGISVECEQYAKLHYITLHSNYLEWPK